MGLALVGFGLGLFSCGVLFGLVWFGLVGFFPTRHFVRFNIWHRGIHLLFSLKIAAKGKNAKGKTS